ncbi:CHRD domain-containing protein [Brachybacterium sp. FME24]|uniref:CHRD domain-containing protein n=1 Tax=Brachybacterium sp. FME24 TaxID=2742605 RepID=UPI001868FA0B|nr:CHRD domain-containing protein [Brachybacterium sp. FME24]
MRTTTKRILPLFAATAMLGMFGASGAALAEGHGGEHGATTLEAHLTELNDSGASGTAWVTVEGNEVTVKMENTGLLSGSPHAQHIHVGGKNQCPDPTMEGSGENGAIQVSDAHDDYGMIVSSLTTEGDTSPDSGLAVDRFPVGDDAYERTFEVSDQVASDITDGKGVIVVHGVDHNGSGEYDGDVMSDLDPNLPSEATDPAACGELEVSQMEHMPEGGAETGDGTTAGIENAGAMIAGGGLIAAAAAGAIALRTRQLQK